MAFTYKLIKRHKNVRYYLNINQVNSRMGQILDDDEETVAEVDLRTNKVTYLTDLPAEVKAAIEAI